MQVLRDEVLKPAVDQKIFYSHGFGNWLEEYCADNFVKIVFMDSTGYGKIVNESQGVWDYSENGGGCWFSNGGIKEYIGYGFSGLYEYDEKQIRHKRGLVTAFGAGWEQCEFCKGWFKPRLWRNPNLKSEPFTVCNPIAGSEPFTASNPHAGSDFYFCPGH